MNTKYYASTKIYVCANEAYIFSAALLVGFSTIMSHYNSINVL